jgi:hypothetical protein
MEKSMFLAALAVPFARSGYHVRMPLMVGDAPFWTLIIGANVRQRQIGQGRILGASATVGSYVPHTRVGKGAGRSDSVQLVEQVQKTEGITL